MNKKIIFAFATICSLQSFYSWASQSQAPQKLYQQVLNILQNNTAVIPTVLQDHPVNTMYNREAIVPPQCYTQTEGHNNPCYICHQDPIPERENVMQDGELQADYSFSDLGMTNHWKNLFEDRTERVAKISDQYITEYISQDNYSELPQRLQEAQFKGWIPDLNDLQLGAGAFDSQGFAKDGSHWVAFNYKPLPSTFWPTNGSTDDVMIRLDKVFRSNQAGQHSQDVYKANLSILEATIKGLSKISCWPIDENKIGQDLNQDGKRGIITEITKVDAYVGAAHKQFISTHLYPKGTEFLHTVRYLGISPAGDITVSTRMKEVRYMRKWKAYAKGVYARQYELESFEKAAGNLPGYMNLGHYGLDNGNGWAIHGFIEDKHGRLRSSTYEENFACMGCHNSIGSTIDKTFSFARKIDGAAGWSYIDLKGMPDAPNQGESKGEIATYLERVGGGSEFRNNEEMFQRWFHADGTLNHEKVAQAKDVYELITPSPERARQLNKAYYTIVQDQDFIFGRDATIAPPKNVYPKIDNDTTPTLPEDRIFDWNIILDWEAATKNSATQAAQTIMGQPENQYAESSHPSR